jgi:hypothetical protein
MFPHERSLGERLANRPFALIGVDSDEDREALKPLLAKENVTWRSFWNGPQGKTGPISTRWNVHGWPTLYILDGKGTIRYKSVGGNPEEIDAMLDKLLVEAGAGGLPKAKETAEKPGKGE